MEFADCIFARAWEIYSGGNILLQKRLSNDTTLSKVINLRCVCVHVNCERKRSRDNLFWVIVKCKYKKWLGADMTDWMHPTHWTLMLRMINFDHHTHLSGRFFCHIEAQQKHVYRGKTETETESKQKLWTDIL